MRHTADEWIAAAWMGQTVVQSDGIPELIWRLGKVKETMFDERGALHCLMSRDECAPLDQSQGDWWCPAALLEVITEEKT